VFSRAIAKFKRKNLQDGYRKKTVELSPSKSRTKAIPLKIKWPYFEILFLMVYVAHRRSQGNLPENEDSSDDVDDDNNDEEDGGGGGRGGGT
jgi:hypothetical protein